MGGRKRDWNKGDGISRGRVGGHTIGFRNHESQPPWHKLTNWSNHVSTRSGKQRLALQLYLSTLPPLYLYIHLSMSPSLLPATHLSILALADCDAHPRRGNLLPNALHLCRRRHTKGAREMHASPQRLELPAPYTHAHQLHASAQRLELALPNHTRTSAARPGAAPRATPPPPHTHTHNSCTPQRSAST